MSKTRMINTRFWGDGYISELEPEEKLLFLYFLTNNQTDLCGVYELPIRTIVFETGMDEVKVRNVLARFSVDKKVEYIDGWIIIKNFLKYQSKTSPKVAQGITRSLKELPESIRSRIPLDTISHSDLDSDLNLDSKRDADASPVFERKIREKDEEYRALVKDLAAKDYLSADAIHKIILDQFLPHWLEKGEGSKKARWQKEKAFDYLKRVRTWVTNHHKFQKPHPDGICSEGMWHRKGEVCHHRPPEVDYKKIPPSHFAMSISKRVDL